MLLISIFLFNLFLLLFSSAEFTNIDCNNYAVIEFSKSNIDNYFQKNQYSIKNNKGFIELDLFPDINSFKCIGSEIQYNESSDKFTSLFGTSTVVYKIVTFTYAYVLYAIFLFFKEKKHFLFLFFLLQNYLIMSYLFFDGSFFNFEFFIYLFVFLLFHYSSKYNYENYYFEIVFSLSLCLLLFNYDIYSKFQIILIFIFFRSFKKYNLRDEHIKLLTLTPIIYFFLRQVSGPVQIFGEIWETISSGMYRGPARFADMFYVYGVIYCNKNSCDTTNNYGPLFELLAFDVNIKVFGFVTSILIILITQYFYFNFMKKINKNHYVIFLLYTCAPFTFLIERMNFDVVVIIFGYFAIYIYEKNYKLISIVVLSLLTLIKVFPIFFIFGIMVYELKNKNNKQLGINSLFFISLAIIYLFYYLSDIQSGFTPNPYGITWTFGVLSDFQNYRNYLESLSIIIYFLIGLIIIVFSKKSDGFRSPILLNSNDQLLEFSFLVTFLPISFYYNFDYRLGFLIIPTILIIKNYNHRFFIMNSSIFLCTSVSPFLIVENISDNIFSFVFSLSYVLLNHASFYVLITLIFRIIFKYLTELKASH